MQRSMVWRRLALVLALSGVVLGCAPRPATAAMPVAVASYRMTVQLDPQNKTVSGTEHITYRNPSPDTLHEVWLRLYLNAFRNTTTTWMRESQGDSRGFQFDANHPGSIDLQSLKLADGGDLLATATLSETLLHVPLPHPLGARAVLEMDAAWTAHLPRVFARTGYGGPANDFFMVGQWYPKLTVYTKGHWDTEPWHANAEFFNDLGSYDVDVTVPQAYMVGAVGVPTGEHSTNVGNKTLSFHATEVTDFSFAASPHFRTLQGKAGATDVIVLYLPEHAAIAEPYLRTASDALGAYSQWYGPYPHPRLTVIDVPDDSAGAGGMEYPMLVTAGSLGAAASFEAIVTAHEVGHEWWPMQTLTNEAREPWLDEGLTEYSGLRYNLQAGDKASFGPLTLDPFAYERLQYALDPLHPATLPSWQYNSSAYGAAVYAKMAMSLWTLEGVVGTAKLRAAMAQYLADYRWTHPTGDDFRHSMRTSLGSGTDWFWALLDSDGVIDYAVRDLSTTPSGTGYHSTVTLARTGSIPAPVELLTIFADGSTKREQWNAATPTISYSYDTPSALVSTLADPDRKLRIELHRVDNGQSLPAETGAATSFGSRLVFWLQTLLQSLGTFG